MAKIKQLKDKSGTEQIFPKTKTQAIFNEDGSLLSDTLDNLYGSLATIESSPTTTSHSVGEYILYQGQVYKVTAVIASGDSLVEGTNISAVNLGDQISTLNGQVNTLDSNLTVSQKVYSGVLNDVTLVSTRYGKVVVVTFYQANTSSWTRGSYLTLATLDPIYRPSRTIPYGVFDNGVNSTSEAVAGIGYINSSGSIQLWMYPSSKNSAIRGTVCYIID